MLESYFGKSNFRRVFIAGGFAAISFAIAAPASADIVKYCLVAKTANVADAGTDKYPEVAMSGEPGEGMARVYSGFKEIGGDQDRDSTDVFNFETEDMGVVSWIDVRKSDGNDWKLHYIRIYRGVHCSGNGSPNGTADGWSEYSINKWIKGGRDTFGPTKIVPAEVTLSPDGSRRSLPAKAVTAVDFYDNTSEIDQSVNLFEETFSSFEQITATSSTSDTTNISASATWTSPQTVAGTFSGSASAGWSRAISEAREESRGKTTEVKADSQYTVAAQSAMFRKQTFSVPYEYQAYRVSSSGKKVALRMLGGPVRGAGFGQNLSIPRTERGGAIVTVGMRELEQNWFRFMSPDAVTEIRSQPNLLPRWKSKGWVVDGSGGTPLGGSTAPPATSPTTAPNATRVGYSTGGMPAPLGVTAKGVNGQNVISARYAKSRIEQTAAKTWTEFGKDGQARNVFQERSRDDWSVYLYDASRDMKMQIDLYRKKIRLTQSGREPFDWLDVDEALRAY